MNPGVAIGIDIGTSGVRAALVDAGREPVAWGAAPVAPEQRRQPQAWWAGVQQALAALAAASPLGNVRAIAVDGTSGTVLAVDAVGTPLGEASLYNDPADRNAVARVAAVAPADSAARGATSPIAKLPGLRDLPGFVRMLHQADWICGRLCGRYDVSDANNALKTGYDPRLGAWPDWLARFDVDSGVLPVVVAPGTPVGSVVDPAALGLPHGVAVVAGTTDGCAAFLATGADQAGDAVTSLGSTMVLKILSDEPVFAPQFGIYSHLVQGRWLAGGASNSGGAALLRHFSPEALVRLSAELDPDADSGLDYYPLPAAGERFPINDPALPSRETPRPASDAAFLHGLLEGIGRIEALGYRRLSELGAPPLRSLRTVGGGARNATWGAIRHRLIGAAMPPARSEEAAVGTAGLALAAVIGSSPTGRPE